MKKFCTVAVLILTAVMMLTACGANAIPGGWQKAESKTVTAELQEIFDKALEGYDGAKLEPVELLSTQVVAGINYRFLCRETVLVPNAEPKEVVVTVFKALDGSCSITDVTEKE